MIVGISLLGCTRGEPEGVIKQMIEPYMLFDHPVMYWETSGNQTALYRILETTNDITCIAHDLKGVLDIKTTGTATYMLRENNGGYIYLTRFEMDRTMFTDIELETGLASMTELVWDASRNDMIAIMGESGNGENVILKLEFARSEAEETFDPDIRSEPEISRVESEWYATPEKITDLTISDDGSMAAISILENEVTGEKGLYFIDNSGNITGRISEDPVIDLGGFSPDGSLYAATYERNNRVEVFLIDMESLELEMITRLPMENRAGHPAWHPNGRYLMYTVDFTEEFREGDTPLQGEQLYLYSLDSMMPRRLAAFDNMTLWVDFSPIGDFFLYSSTPGVMSRTGRAVVMTDVESGLETWSLSYVPWDPEEFTTANASLLTPDQNQHMVNYTVGGDTKIGFVWGPDGELPVENW